MVNVTGGTLARQESIANMELILITVIPVFALIALGYGAARFKLFTAGGEKAISLFVFGFAIPALLFRTLAKVDAAAAPWDLWGAFFGAWAIVWLLAILVARYLPPISGVGGAAAAIGSAFGNLVLLGIPLSVSYFGEAAALPAGLIISIHAPIQWLSATLRAETAGRSHGQSVSSMLAKLVADLVRNPIVMAIVAGSLWRVSGLGIHPLVDRTISMLGQAGVPTALFVLGLSLTSFGFKGNVRSVTALLVLKMAVFPALAAIMAFGIFDLDPVAGGVVVLFASLPTGVNAYMFAAKYETAVAPISGAIAIGVALSVFTVSLTLWFLGA